MTNRVLPNIRSSKKSQNEILPINMDTLESEDTDEIKFKPSTVIKIPWLNVDVDAVGLFAYIIAIIILILLWKSLGLFEYVKKEKYILIILIVEIIFFISQIFMSDIKTANFAVEQIKIDSVEEKSGVLMSGAILLFGILNYITNNKIRNLDSNIYKSLLLSIFFIVFVFVFVSIKKDAEYLRNLRKIKQIFLTFSIGFFVIPIFVLIKSTL